MPLAQFVPPALLVVLALLAALALPGTGLQGCLVVLDEVGKWHVLASGMSWIFWHKEVACLGTETRFGMSGTKDSVVLWLRNNIHIISRPCLYHVVYMIIEHVLAIKKS